MGISRYSIFQFLILTGSNDTESQSDRTQFFAVAHSLNSVEKLRHDENSYVTLKALELEYYHKLGTRYEGLEYTGIYKIDWESDHNSFSQPKLSIKIQFYSNFSVLS
jgi:hypothetical protein